MRDIRANEVDTYKLDSVRMNAYGSFLRKTSLDELPNLINVLKGEMSFVGPRPLLVKYLGHFSNIENVRHDVKPGITGLAQVSGRNTIDWKTKLNLDVYYVKNLSFFNDAIILFKTFFSIFNINSVQASPKETMPGLVKQKSEYLNNAKNYKGFHYSVLSPEKIEYLHSKTLEMFIEVRAILDSNKIDYMICGGTLLGAYTTNTFIPWDDDFDMCIFEKDYHKVWTLLNKNLSSNFVVQNKELDPNYYLGWMKIRDKRSHTYPDAPLFQHNGVWIDIYLLKPIKRNMVDYFVAKESIDYLYRRLLVGGLTNEEYNQRMSDLDAHEKPKSSYISIESTFPDDNIFVIWSASKITLESDWVYPLSKVNFEGLEVTTFAKPKDYLQNHYGSGFSAYPKDEDRTIGINHLEIMDLQ